MLTPCFELGESHPSPDAEQHDDFGDHDRQREFHLLCDLRGRNRHGRQSDPREQHPEGQPGSLRLGRRHLQPIREAGLNLTINNDLFENNTAGSSSVDPFYGYGGAIDAENGSTVSVTSSTFIDNQSISPQAQGGAISLTTFTYEFPGVYGSLR